MAMVVFGGPLRPSQRLVWILQTSVAPFLLPAFVLGHALVVEVAAL